MRGLNIDVRSVQQLECTPPLRGQALVCVLDHKTTGKPEVTANPWASSLRQGFGDKGTRTRVPKVYLSSAGFYENRSEGKARGCSLGWQPG